MQKIWSQYFKKKMEREMAQYAQIEKAFQDIRSCAGNSDVKEMVTKFMQREQTYAHLLNAVSENEKKYEQLKSENEFKSERLHQLQIENDNKRKVDEKRGGSEADLLDTMHQDGDNVEMEYAKLSTEMEQL